MHSHWSFVVLFCVFTTGLAKTSAMDDAGTPRHTFRRRRRVHQRWLYWVYSRHVGLGSTGRKQDCAHNCADTIKTSTSPVSTNYHFELKSWSHNTSWWHHANAHRHLAGRRALNFAPHLQSHCTATVQLGGHFHVHLRKSEQFDQKPHHQQTASRRQSGAQLRPYSAPLANQYCAKQSSRHVSSR